MPSTYTTNLGIEKIATGEQSGTWGTTTNTNLDLIDEAVNGVEQVTLAAAGSSGSPNDLPVTNGASSDGRNKYIEFNDGGDLGGTAYVQLTPNDAEKIVHIRNSLSASRSILIFQGTYNASNDFEIPNGADVVLKFDGAGAGAVVSDVNVNLTPTKLTTADLVATTADINGGTGGTIKLDGNYPVGTANVALGNAALDDGSLTGNNNTAIGADTLTAATTASANTAVGTNALEANQTGFSNTGIGFDALKVNTAGSNTAVGASALSANTSGSSSVAVGKSALAANTTGIQNVAIGASALDANTTASANTAVGEQSLTDNTTGASNTAVGKGSLANNTTANNNTAVGYFALVANTTGTDNVAVGKSALDANTTATNNTAVGSESLTNVTTSAYNVGVGASSGQTLTTGAQNTFLGANAGDQITTGGKHTIVGRYNGNQGGLDIRTSDNYIVLSDGDQNIRGIFNSDGAFMVARTTVGLDGTFGFSTEGDSYRTFLETNTDPCLYLNRHGNDGELAVFRQANVTEGTITVSGSTVSYNGGHLARWSQLIDNSVDNTIVKGTVLSNLDEMCEWKRVEFDNDYLVSEATDDQDAVYETRPFSESYDGDANIGDVIDWEFQGKIVQATVIAENNEQLNKTKVSDAEGDSNVAGVFVSWDDDGDMNIAMTGDMVIRIAQGTTVQRGDLLMSAGDGTAKPQGDDIVRSKTIAKVTSTHVSHTYDDGSYLVPCVLMAC